MYPGSFAHTAGDRPAVIMGSSGEVVTYRQLEERSNRFAHYLRSQGLRQGDVVAVLMENNAFYHEVVWGARRSGLYFTTINSHLTVDEAAYIINDCGARVLVSSTALAEMAAQLTLQLIPGVERRLMIAEDGDPAFFDQLDGWLPYTGAVVNRPTTPIADESEGDLLQYSSGTTGRPKGIKRKLSGSPISLDTDPVVPFLRAIGFGENDVYLSPAPLYHSAPIVWTMGVHRLGGTVVVMERFDPAGYLALVERYHVTHSQLVPTMFVRMLKLPPEQRARHDLSSLRCVIHAAAPCPVQIKHQMIEWWGPIISEFYSSSEGAGATFITSPEWLAHPGSVGRTMIGKPHILDDDGRELSAGEPGTIWFADGIPFEYLNDLAKTAGARNDRGWTTVGDVGYLDDDGYLYLTDRRSFMIISGGVNIYPQEAENLLITHPGVLDVAVIGVPNADFGEEVKAVVQPLDWADAGPALQEELIAFCREHLAAYKCPRSVDFEPELPRLDTGKLYKRILRDRYWAPSAVD